MNYCVLTKNSTSLKVITKVLATLACMSLLTACSRGRPTQFFTGKDYLRLRTGQMYRAPRDMVLATESVIQKKDQQILDLIRANRKLATENALLRGARHGD